MKGAKIMGYLNISKNLVCPKCNSKIEIKKGFYHCVNTKCDYEKAVEKPGEEKDFWDINMKSDANVNGVSMEKCHKDVALTQRQFNLAIAGLLFYGFAINAVECAFLMEWAFKMAFPVLIVGFISCMHGFNLMKKSNNPYESFVGYNFIVVPQGLVLTMFVAYYDFYIILDACCITALFTILMALVGTFFPKMFLDKGGH